MAQERNLSEFRFNHFGTTSETNRVQSAVDAFEEFCTSGIWSSDYARKAEADGWDIFKGCVCFLDWAYLWLRYGDAVVQCPTFESWLVAIIASIDYCVGPWFQSPDVRDPQSKDRHAIFNVSPRLGKEKDPKHGEENYNHPAIRRDVYEYIRAGRLAGTLSR